MDNRIVRLRKKFGLDENTNEIWNFAFGSNMDPKVLEKRRKIKPMKSVAAVLYGFKLDFSLPTVMLITEPSMGNIKEEKGAAVHGVCHCLTLKDFDHLLKTEGGGGENTRRGGYTCKKVDCIAYDGSKITAYALQAVEDMGYERPPSQRYKAILIAGAKHHGLSPSYIQYLEKLPSVASSKFAYVINILLILPLVIPLLSLLAVTMITKRSGRYVWELYYLVLKIIHGVEEKLFPTRVARHIRIMKEFPSYKENPK